MARLFTVMIALFAAVLCCCPADAQLMDDFDSYANGTDMHMTGGWRGWNNSPGATAFVTNALANSAPNSLEVGGGSDLIHEMNQPTSGQWRMTIDQYIPTGLTGDQYFIMLNTYGDAASPNGPATENWSVELQFDGATSTLIDDFDAAVSIPIVFDQWVEIRVDVDLDNDTVDQYYNGTLVNAGQQWSERGSGGGAVAIGALDLFSDNASPIYYDNAKFVQIPEPTTGLMLLAGLCGLGLVRRR